MKLFFPTLIVCFLSLSCSDVQNTQWGDISQYKATFTSAPQRVPTDKTTDGPLAGNGDIGIVMGGSPDSLCFYIGKNDFWRAYPVYPGGGIASPGGLELFIDKLAQADYYAEQDPGEAAIRGRFTGEGIDVELKAWVAAMHNAVVIEMISSAACEVSARLWATEGNTSVNNAGRNGGIAWVTRSFENSPLLEWPSHIAMAACIPEDGIIRLSPGDKHTLVVTAYTNHDRHDWKQAAVSDAVMSGDKLAEMESAHREWWRDYWAKSRVSIGDSFLERYYYSSLYLLGCSSREGKFAPGIWGSFVTRDYAAWGGDYHLNYNYQAPYWCLYSSNRIEQTDNFDRPLLDYMEHGREHARSLLDCRGIYYPVGIGPMGLCTTRWPLTPEEMLERYATRENTIDDGYKFLGQKINAVFSVGNMMMRFYSTYDMEYAERVYPYIVACTEFWEDYLTFEDGRYVIKMDHFNEVMPNKRNNGQWRHRLGDFNSTLSLGLVRMLFKGAVDMSGYLGAGEERLGKWTHILEHLSDYPVGITYDGRRSLKNMEFGPGGSDIRASGLNRVSIHGLILPAGVCGPVTDAGFNEILLNDVAHWIDHKSTPGGWGNTFGNGIETCFPGAVRVGYNPDVILSELRERIEAAVYPNDYIIQTGGGIEVFSAVPMTVNEMLMQSYEGVIRLFPVWNRSKDASFENLRAYGAFLVSGSLSGGEIGQVNLTSEKGSPCRMENPWDGATVTLCRNGKKAETLSGEMLEFATDAGEKITMKKI